MSSKKEIQDVIEAMTATFKKNDAEQMQGIVAAATRVYSPGSLTPEAFSSLISYGVLEKAKEQLIEAYFPEAKENHRIKTAIFYYDFMEAILKQIMVDVNKTMACSADYARWVLRSYFKFCKDGTLPEMEEGKGAALKPHFGDAETWMYLCDTMTKLCYGHPLEFLLAYSHLVAEGKGLDNEKP